MTAKSINNFFSFSDRKDLTPIIKPDTSITYKDLFIKAHNIAQFLLKKGIGRRNYIPLLIEDNLSFIEIAIALWMIGAVPVPINTKMLDEEIFSIIDDYDFDFLITESLYANRDSFVSLCFDSKRKNNTVSHKDTKAQSFTKKSKLLIINLDEIITTQTDAATFSVPDQKDEAVVIFTSGSTDRPKGVVHTFKSLINSIENGNQILNHKEKDSWLASLPFYHIGGFQIICRSLYYGCSIIIPESLHTNHLAHAITNYKPTHLSLVSTQLERLLHQKVKPDKSLKVSLIGGGFIDDGLMFEADKLGWKPFRVYGSSETASMVTAISVEEIKSKPQAVGKCFSNVEINISDNSEILIKSNSLFKKYLDDEIETSSYLINGFYHSGDLGFIDEDVYLFIEARRNDLIVSGGENVNPIEVEKAILQIEGIIDVCVFAKQDKTWGHIVAAAIVTKNPSVDEKNIKEILKQRLAGYKIPKNFYFTDALPRTALGKLERDKIKKMF